ERKIRNAEYHDIVGSSRDKFRNLVNSHNYMAGNRSGRRTRVAEKYFNEFRSRLWERPEESQRSRTPPPSYEEVSSMLDCREVSATHRGRSMSPSGRSNNSRSHSNVNQGIGGASTAETNRQNPEPRAPTSTENNPDNDGANNEINATGNSDNMTCPDPTPIAFFRYTFPAHKTKASDNYQKSLDLALNTANNQEIKDKLKIMKETVDILVCRNVRSTNLNLHKEINTLSLNKDESLAKNTNLDGIDDDDSYNNFIEHGEENQPTTHRSWVLKSGTNVGDELAKYVKTIPEAHKYDWEEINESFKKEVSKKNDEYIINAIDDLTPEMIEKNRKVKFSDEDKEIFNGLRCAVITYAENLKDLEVPISEADFDNSFPNMLTKRFLNKRDLKMDVGEIACWASARRRNKGRSIVLQARIGQKCDFRGTLKNSINNLEAIIGLRSGNLPVAHRKKIHEDRVDLSIAMHDVLYNFFKTNPNASGNSFIVHMFLEFNRGIGRLSQKKMPNTLKTLAILQGFYATMSDIKSTLKIICDHTNGVSLSDSRLHRERKRKIPVYSEQSGLFSTPSSSPIKKGKCENQ
ncbi:5061_t:CDS:10, partial [Entrophospora sp. SA101]